MVDLQLTGRTIGQRLRSARAAANQTQEEVADVAGISPQAVSQWESDRTRPDQEKLAHLAKHFRVYLEWLLTGQGPKINGVELAPASLGNKMVPVIDRVEAGMWGETADAYAPGSGSSSLMTDYPVSKDSFALDIIGTSMSPEFTPGDRVIIDPTISPRPGDFVVAKRDVDEAATFKKYRERGSDPAGKPIVELVPLNSDWPTLLIDADHPGRIIGTMIEHRRYRPHHKDM